MNWTEVLMRRVSILLILLLALAACNSDDDDDADIDEPTPVPTEIVDEEAPDPTPTEVPPEPTPEPSPTPESDDDSDAFDLDAFVDQVVQNVVELRGLELLEELQFSVMSREELIEVLEEETEIEQAEIDLYWILRLLDDRNIDLEQLLIDAQGADIYGFYDVETSETYVIAEDDELSAMEEVFLAHEITHALQDQHYDLSRLYMDNGDYDRSMAFRAIIEGDAVLTQELYAQTYLDRDRQMEYLREAMAALRDSGSIAAIDALPTYVIETLSFPYVAGPSFVLQIYENDLSSINAYLEDPPVSTQQVMDPNRYLTGEIADPVSIEIPDMHDRLGDSWELYDEGTLGVFDLSIMLEVNGVPDYGDLFDGWSGSTFAMYENGSDVVVILSSQWASDQTAADFEAILVETMADYLVEDGVWMGDGRFHTIAIEGDMVTLTSASEEGALMNVAGLN